MSWSIQPPARQACFNHYLIYGICFFLLLTAACNKDDDEDSTVPQSADYDIVITGQPGFVTNGQPTYSGSFQIQGILVVRPTIADGTQSNGVNPIEIGIFTNPNPLGGRQVPYILAQTLRFPTW